MRSIPDFAVIKATASQPMPDAVVAKGRYIVGALALSGAFYVLGSADSAYAAPAGSSIALAAPASATPAQTTVDSAESYVIQSGDTLGAISARVGVSVGSLATVNGINDYNRIWAGQTLLIPVKHAVAAAAPAKTAKVTQAAKGHTVPAAGAPSPGQPLPAELQGTQRAQLNQVFNDAGAAYGVSAELLKALTYQESGWNNTVVSGSGAIGIGQLMPATVEFVNTQLLTKPLDPAVPAQNVKMSAAFLSYLLDQTNGDESLAIAAYYQGLGAVKNVGIYDDTQVYVTSVLAIKSRWF